MNQFRPRLTEGEIQFLIESLKHTLAVVERKEKEYEALKAKVYNLKRELHYNSMVWKELKAAKEELSSCNVKMMGLHYRCVISSLVRRFEAMLKGGKLHSSSFAEQSLRQINLEPKNLEKSKSL